jgi:hypothetical protein
MHSAVGSPGLLVALALLMTKRRRQIHQIQKKVVNPN